MTTVPHQGPLGNPDGSESGTGLPSVASSNNLEAIRSSARTYMSAGWHVMLLKVDGAGGKIPPANCPRCKVGSPEFVRHPPQECGHLLCHGFYMATTDLSRFDQMLVALPSGSLAVRTGRISNLLVLDVEASSRPGEPSGLEVLDEWQRYAQVDWDLTETRVSRSVSGGRHLYYWVPSAGPRLVSGRILAGIDVKGDDAYVGVPIIGQGDARNGQAAEVGRTWLNPSVPIAVAPQELVDWLVSRSRRGIGGSGTGGGSTAPEGYDYAGFLRSGCPGGHRQYFINDLCFRLRRNGVDRDEYDEKVWGAFDAMAQPPEADYEMPWADVSYIAERVWATIEPNPETGLSSAQRAWAGYATNARQPIRVVEDESSVVGVDGDGGAPTGPGPVVMEPPPEFERDLTETGNAHRFVNLFRDRVLYVVGLGWYRWNGQVWEQDAKDDVLDMTQEVLVELRREQAAAAGNQDRQDALGRWYNTSSSIRSRKATLVAAASDPRMKVLMDDMNLDPLLLVVQNGTLELATGTLRPSRPEDHNTQTAACTYDPDATCPLWLQHVDLITRHADGSADPALAAFLQRWAGYTLTGLVKEQKFFFGFGGGNNGKNVFIETLLGLMGTYAIRGSAQILTGSGSEHETIIADLAGARMVFIDETPHGRINEARVKALTGSSKIRARKMRENSFEFDVKFKMWIAGNNKPVITDTSKGFWRRLDLVPFDTTITDVIPGYADILAQEWPGILNWALAGLKDYLGQGVMGLAQPGRVITAGHEYQSEENVFGRFVEENFVLDSDEVVWTPNNALQYAYQNWCQQEGIKNPLSTQKLANDWRQAGFVRPEKPRKIRQGYPDLRNITQRGWIGPRLNYVPQHLKWEETTFASEEV